MLAMALGSPTTIPVKMISDMPLPMPRSLICSPSHMMNAVPVVSEMMVRKTKPAPGLMTIPCCIACKPCAIPKDWRTERTRYLPIILSVLQTLRDPEGLENREDDGQVAGPLRDLAAAQFAFLLQLFQGGDHHGEQLQNDRRRNVRHDPRSEEH